MQAPDPANEIAVKADQNRAARLEMTQHLLKKGGYHFLLHLLSKIDKNTDFALDVKRSRCIHLILQLLMRCYYPKL